MKNLFLRKSLKMLKKLKGGSLWDFSTHIILSQNIKKVKGNPLGKLFLPKKVLQRRNNSQCPLVSPGIVYCMLRGKREKPFSFSSLGQMIQFGTIKFRRTYKNFFGQFVWIHEAPTENDFQSLLESS